MNTVSRSGRYYRVADPQWDDPLDASYSMAVGGRWNAKESFAVLYLNQTVDVARANCRPILTTKLAGSPITVDDFESSELPVLVTTDVPEDEFLDILSDEGRSAVGLPISYPLDVFGNAVGWNDCQPIGTAAYEGGLGGVACPSAALDYPSEGEELARFQRENDGALEAIDVATFVDWYGPLDW